MGRKKPKKKPSFKKRKWTGYAKAPGSYSRVEIRKEIETVNLNRGKTPPKDLNFYQVRDKSLKRMGFACYGAYLKSDIWLSIRERVMVRDHRQCWCCASPANAVHHRRYDHQTLTGRDLSGLVAICNACHKKIEFDVGGNKHTHQGLVDKELVKMRERMRPKPQPPRPSTWIKPPTNKCNVSGTKQDDYWTQQPTSILRYRHQ